MLFCWNLGTIIELMGISQLRCFQTERTPSRVGHCVFMSETKCVEEEESTRAD
jgi:hypothetical protein